jgi:hypothetical protein
MRTIGRSLKRPRPNHDFQSAIANDELAGKDRLRLPLPFIALRAESNLYSNFNYIRVRSFIPGGAPLSEAVPLLAGSLSIPTGDRYPPINGGSSLQ